MKDIVIRNADLSDAERLSEIYAYYVENTAVSFEYTAPTAEEFRERMRVTMKAYPYLVAEKEGKLIGYTYAGSFHKRAAYARSCEVSIYVEKNQRGIGAGRLLYEEIEQRLKEAGFLNMYAAIAYPEQEDEYLTFASPTFHARMGFEKVAHFHYCSYKFGRWYHSIWMEKLIGAHISQR